MALIKRFKNLRSEENTGFASRSSDSGGRFYNRRSNTANVVKRGVNILNRYSWYHTMLGLSRWKFLLLIFSGYIIINLIFASIYFAIGIQHLNGVNSGSTLKNFSEVFFFSTQTFTTVGYGRISPVGFLTSSVATLEAFLGLLSFALATGLFYGRFSKPKAFIQFSEIALIAPFKDATALMFRIAPYKNNDLAELKAEVTMAMQVEENDKMINKFYDLDLQFSELNALASSWTLVHPINEKSPLYGFSENDIKNTKIEVLVFIRGFDTIFSNTVMTRYSYISEEMIWGAKFKMMFYPNEDKTKTILDLGKLNDFEHVELPSLAEAASN